MASSQAALPPSAQAPVRAPVARNGLSSRAWWPWARRGLTAVFFGLVAWLLVSQARAIEWEEVLSALELYPLTAAFGAVALTFASFALYSCFDLIGRRYTGHRLPLPTVMGVTAVSYAFNLNLGSWVGGVAFRYRLYARLGLTTGVITRVMTLSMLANWMGYIMLAGALFSFMPPTLPDSWAISSGQLHVAGYFLLAIAAAYLGLCAFSRRRVFFVRGHEIDLPSIRLALLQLSMGASNWLLMSGIVFVLLQHQVEFAAVASVLLLAAVAGVITHVPGNLGVLEAVFVALLSHLVSVPDLLAALVAYRVLYYLTPLALAGLGYLALELHAKRLRKAAAERVPQYS
jgi:uncharacterized membrane protein YbhN (UPF0104 family)